MASTLPLPVRVLLADPADLTGAPPAVFAVLDEADRTHVARLRQAAHRHQALCSRLVQRLAVAGVGGTAPADLRFAADAHGRPQATGAAAGVAFSATNCTGLVACVAGRGLALGLDAEPLDRPLPLELLDGCLALDERAALARQPPDARAAFFFRLWTLKEAWFKARGRGIDAAPSSVGLVADDGAPRAALGSPALGWSLRLLDGAPSHALALCSDRPCAPRLERLRWDGARLAFDAVGA